MSIVNRIITTNAYHEQRAVILNKHASAQKAISMHTATKDNLNLTHSIFVQQLLRNIPPFFVPDHVNQIILDFLDIKIMGKLQIATGGFFRTEMKEALSYDNNIYLFHHK